MRFEQHCEMCQRDLGAPFKEVNRWLDELAWVDRGAWAPKAFDPAHRRFRHHRVGVETVRAKWGDQAARAAELHIMADLFLKRPEEIPLDERDYLRKGFH